MPGVFPYRFSFHGKLDEKLMELNPFEIKYRTLLAD